MSSFSSQVEPELALLFDGHAGAHHLEHDFLARNVDAVRALARHVPVRRVDQLVWATRHLVQLWVDVVQASFDVLVVVRERIGHSNLSEAVDITGK